MSSVLEFEGKSLEKAIEKACEELKISSENLKYEIVSYGSSGIFGLVGVKKARIKVFLEKNDLKENGDKPSKLQEPLPVEEEKIFSKETVTNEILEDLAKSGKGVLEKILMSMVEDMDIRVEVKEREIHYHVSSTKSAIIIGKRGQTLEAVQYILDKIMNKSRTTKVRIQVDIEGYLESRKESLEEMAHKLSEKAKKTGRPVAVGSMNAHDRKIIHITLKNDRKVRTQSMGEGVLKKLVIFPKKKNPPKRKPNPEAIQ
jgi:spoIIIJ-associated protein